MPSFEERVRQLCNQVIACHGEAETIELTRQLQALMHERIEHLRGNLGTLPIVTDSLDEG